MSTRAMLDGQEFDLAALARSFPDGDPCVVRTVEGTFIESVALDAVEFADGDQLVEVASRILWRMNGWAILNDPGYRRVTLHNRFHRDRDKSGHDDVHIYAADEVRSQDEAIIQVVAAVETRLGLFAEASVAPSGSDGSNRAVVTDGQRKLALAMMHPPAEELFTLIGRSGDLGWSELWKLMEIVREDVGSKKALIDTGWVTEDDWEAFGYSANHPEASGADARHARRRPRTPPKGIMSLSDGQRFIRDLAERWLDSIS